MIDTVKTTKKKVDTIRIVDTSVIGRAYYSKGGAFVENDTCIYYMDTIDAWDENVYGKIVKVSGKLLVLDLDPKEIDSEKEDSEEIEDTTTRITFEDETYEQRVYGIKYTILNPKWELVDATKKK